MYITSQARRQTARVSFSLSFPATNGCPLVYGLVFTLTLLQSSPPAWVLFPLAPKSVCFLPLHLLPQVVGNMRSATISSLLTFIALGFASPAPPMTETVTSATQTTSASGFSTSTPISPTAGGALVAAADDDATTTITLASAQTVIISVPGQQPYTAIPEQGYVQVQVAVEVSFVVDYSNPSSTIGTVTQTQTIERRVDFCTKTTTIGVS
jgi:hypothetical protein